MLTQTEENYLKSIYQLYELSKETVSTNAIARHLHTTAASVTDMMKKLAAKDLIIYEKYRGSKLSSTGYHIATHLIRKHRLWETFLVEKLGFSWDEVHEIAEQLEHIQSLELVDRLDEYLQFPKFDPHGDPIPNSDGKFTLRDQVSLNLLEEREEGIIVGVKKHDRAFLQHLNQKGIALGKSLVVLSKNSYDRSLQIELNNDDKQTVSDMVSRNLLVKRMRKDD